MTGQRLASHGLRGTEDTRQCWLNSGWLAPMPPALEHSPHRNARCDRAHRSQVPTRGGSSRSDIDV